MIVPFLRCSPRRFWVSCSHSADSLAHRHYITSLIFYIAIKNVFLIYCIIVKYIFLIYCIAVTNVSLIYCISVKNVSWIYCIAVKNISLIHCIAVKIISLIYYIAMESISLIYCNCYKKYITAIAELVGSGLYSIAVKKYVISTSTPASASRTIKEKGLFC